MEKRLLITGFDAFGGSEENPSWLAVSQLPDTVGNFPHFPNGTVPGIQMLQD